MVYAAHFEAYPPCETSTLPDDWRGSARCLLLRCEKGMRPGNRSSLPDTLLLQDKGFCWSVWRLSRCQPFNPGGLMKAQTSTRELAAWAAVNLANTRARQRGGFSSTAITTVDVSFLALITTQCHVQIGRHRSMVDRAAWAVLGKRCRRRQQRTHSVITRKLHIHSFDHASPFTPTPPLAPLQQANVPALPTLLRNGTSLAQLHFDESHCRLPPKSSRADPSALLPPPTRALLDPTTSSRCQRVAGMSAPCRRLPRGLHLGT